MRDKPIRNIMSKMTKHERATTMALFEKLTDAANLKNNASSIKLIVPLRAAKIKRTRPHSLTKKETNCTFTLIVLFRRR